MRSETTGNRRSIWLGRRHWIIGLIKLTLGGVLLFAMLRWFEHRQVYIPSSRMDRGGEWLGRAWEDVYFKASDGTVLNGWFFPCGAESKCPDVAVILCHGNAGNISHRFEKYSLLLDLGLNVFAFDYRGYGRSKGKPGEEGTYQDAEAAYQWLLSKGFASERIVGMGESLGGGVVSELAVRAKLGGLILQSSFTSIPDLGSELFPWLPVQRMASIRYDTIGKLPKIRVPVLIMHSREDSLIGYHHAERNFASANSPKRIVELSGDHNETLASSFDAYRNGIRDFLVFAGLSD